jgi:hypothetical protein
MPIFLLLPIKLIAVAGPGHWLTLAHLDKAIQSGKPQSQHALGMEIWDYDEQHE